MTELEDCYFCGSIEELQQRPVVPPDLDPDEETQRRVVVCPTCGEKLDRVVEPILAHAGEAGDPGEGADEGDEQDAAGDGPDAGGEAEDRTPEPDEAESPPDEPEEDAIDEPGGTDEDAIDEPGQDETGESSGDATGEDDGGKVDGEETGDDGTDEEEDGDGDTDEGEDDTDEKAGDGDTDGEETGGDDESEGETDDDDPVELPEQTSELVRLLGNREFPIEREEILAVASSAYDVRYEEADAVLEALIERGQLAEEDGTLYRPG